MASLNSVQLICRVGSDPEVRQFESGKICTFRAATSDIFTDRNGQRQEQTEWHSITLSGKLADLSAYIYKGCMLYVGGKLRTRSWTDQNGTTRSQTEIVGLSVQLLSPRRDNATAQPTPQYQAPAPAPASQPQYATPQSPAPQGYAQPQQPQYPTNTTPPSIPQYQHPTMGGSVGEDLGF